MKNRRSIKLLSKTTLFYLVFTFLAFFLSAVFLTREAEEFINDELAHRFNYVEKKVRRQIRDGKAGEKLPSSAALSALAIEPDLSVNPVFSDTLMYNAENEELQLYRKKTILFMEGGTTYKLEITKSLEDFYRLKNAIFGALIPAFIILAIAIILFNSLLSGSLYKPFNKILTQMRTYKVGSGTTVKTVRTATTEFRKMQQLFLEMVDRIENDYRNLKEYTENMAHEIQTPLTVIRNKTENLIADENVMNLQASTVKIIYDETNHLSKLGYTLNLLTKIENHEFSKAEFISTRPVIEKHLESISEVARLKSIKIETSISEEHQLYIDPFLLDIVIKNLLRNALRYGTPQGPIRVKSSADQLSFSNYGPPLDENPEKIFERFFRKNGSQSAQGLGLSLVKKICDLNNLHILYTYEDQQHHFTITGNQPY